MSDDADKKTVEAAEEKAPAAQAASTPEVKPDSSARLVITLFAVALVAAAALAGGNVLTKDRIAAAKARIKLASIKKVLPKCTNNPVKDAIKVKDAKGAKTEVYRCRMKQADGADPVVAVAIEQSSNGNKSKPYSGEIKVMVGIDTKTGKIRAYKGKHGPEVAVVIVKHSETPGLGSKAADYDFRKAYVGRDLVDKDKTSKGKVWVVKKDNPQLGFVDAISGATITSRAVTEIVHKAMTVYNLNKQAILTTVKGAKPAPKGAKPAPKGAMPAPKKPAPRTKQ